MEKVTAYKNIDGEDMVMLTNDDGSIWSGYKSAYDEQQAEAKSVK